MSRFAAFEALARAGCIGARSLGVGLPLMAALIGVARADDALTLARSPAQRCLMPAEDKRVKPDYPADMLRLKQGARVSVELVFNGPDASPEVNFDEDPSSDFRLAVKDYARQLRVPCMSRGDGPVKLRQEFDFTPNDGRKVAWSTPLDEANPRRKALLACIVQPATSEAGGIYYPDALLREGREANVVVRLHFVDRTKPPVVEVLDNGGNRRWVDAITSYIERMRMPCLESEPVDVQYVYRFTIDNVATRRVLNDMSLSQFVNAIKPIPPGSIFFDTTAMKCPFDVRLTFKQPWEPNRVEELDEDLPARHTFLDWIAAQQFNVGAKEANALLGQQMTLRIPCARVDL